MKKKSIILIALLAIFVGSAQAQWFDFSNNRRASVGLNLGVVGYNLTPQGIDPNIADFGWGINFSLLGIYLDFIYQNPQHRWDRTITQIEYPDQTALAINLGYQIPVLPWLFVTPVVGYSNDTWGRTLGNSIGVDSDIYRIYHDYVRDGINNHFNYGVGLMVRPVEFLEIGVMGTSHALYGTVSFSGNAK